MVSAGPSDSKAESANNVTEKRTMTTRAAIMSKGFFDGELNDSVLLVKVIDLDADDGQHRHPEMSEVN